MVGIGLGRRVREPRAGTEEGEDARGELSAEIGRRVVNEVIELAGVEMNFGEVVLSAGPKDRKAQSEGEAGFEIDAAAVLGEIGDDETGASDLSDDPIVDFAAVLIGEGAERSPTGVFDAGSDPFVENRAVLGRGAHGDEAEIASSGLVFARFVDGAPTFQGKDAFRALSGVPVEASKQPARFQLFEEEPQSLRLLTGEGQGKVSPAVKHDRLAGKGASAREGLEKPGGLFGRARRSLSKQGGQRVLPNSQPPALVVILARQAREKRLRRFVAGR